MVLTKQKIKERDDDVMSHHETIKFKINRIITIIINRNKKQKKKYF